MRQKLGFTGGRKDTIRPRGQALRSNIRMVKPLD
jgi:hypothetical protein